jgi:hypothetical protein
MATGARMDDRGEETLKILSPQSRIYLFFYHEFEKYSIIHELSRIAKALKRRCCAHGCTLVKQICLILLKIWAIYTIIILSRENFTKIFGDVNNKM